MVYTKRVIIQIEHDSLGGYTAKKQLYISGHNDLNSVFMTHFLIHSTFFPCQIAIDFINADELLFIFNNS